MPEQDSSKRPERDADRQTPPFTPSSTQQVTVPLSSRPSIDEQKASPKEKAKWTDKTMAFFTVLLFLAAVIQAGIFYKQWEEMHSGGVDTNTLANAAKTQAEEAIKQVAKMEESNRKTDQLIAQAAAQANATHDLAIAAGTQAGASKAIAEKTTEQADATKRLADEAKRSADLAKTSVDDNKAAAYRAARPYVYVSRLEFDGDFVKGDMVKGTAFVVNSGQTPATTVDGCSDFALLPNGQPMSDNFQCPALNNPVQLSQGEHSRFVLGAGAKDFALHNSWSVQPENLTKEQFGKLLAAGDFRIYYYGYIHYSDMTNPSVVHHTEFCGRFNFTTGQIDICEKHNHVD